MSTDTKKEITVAYPIETVYDTLVSIFPVKYYDLRGYNHSSYYFSVIDSFNREFIMDISLYEKTIDNTIISFHADYPLALIDLTHGGKQAIETVIEKLLDELDKEYGKGSLENENGDMEIVTKDNFINTTKNNPHTAAIAFGYVLSLLSNVLPFYSLMYYDPEDFVMFIFFLTGILSLSIEISLSVILQYYENPKAVLHGRIQTCLCGLSLIILGFTVHPSLAIAGIVIPVIVIGYFLKREKSSG